MEEYWKTSSFLFVIGLLILPVTMLSLLAKDVLTFSFFFPLSMFFFLIGMINLMRHWILNKIRI